MNYLGTSYRTKHLLCRQCIWEMREGMGNITTTDMLCDLITCGHTSDEFFNCSNIYSVKSCKYYICNSIQLHLTKMQESKNGIVIVCSYALRLLVVHFKVIFSMNRVHVYIKKVTISSCFHFFFKSFTPFSADNMSCFHLHFKLPLSRKSTLKFTEML